MILEDIAQDIVVENRMVWRKMGNKVVRAVRCTSGIRKGRVVSKSSKCSEHIKMKKRMTIKKTRAKMGARITRKSQRTKRMNPASRRVRALNKRRR